MAKTKLTDDVRILLSLKHGYHVIDYYKSGYGWSNPPVRWCAIQSSPNPDEACLRSVSGAAVWRCKRSGLTEPCDSSEETGLGHTFRFKLTDAGLAAADAIEGITIDEAISPPKRTPRPEGMDWIDERNWKTARKVLKILVDQGKVLTEVRHALREGVYHYTYPIMKYGTKPDTEHLQPSEFKYLAAFVERAPDGVDQWRRPTICWRPNAAGIDLIERRKPLPVVIDESKAA